jgi:SAM-dependent methyltransferase
MGLGLGIMPRLTAIWHGSTLKPIRRAWQTRFYSTGKVALGERVALNGNFPLDWIHIDWRDADYTVNLVENPVLPFDDNSQRLIYSAHLIEHLPETTLNTLLREAHRVLKPGGRIRIECPDAEKLVELYRRGDEHMLTHFRESRRKVLVEYLGLGEKYLEDHLSVLGEISNYLLPGEPHHVPTYATKDEFDAKLSSLDLDQFADWCFSLQTPEQRRSGGHQNILYHSKLKRLLEEAGFMDVVAADFDLTTIPELRLNQSGRSSIKTKPHRRFYSLYIEATSGAGAHAPAANGRADRDPVALTRNGLN